MTLLSKVANSLYWMSRYLERAEHTARMLDVHVNLALDASSLIGQQQHRNLVLGCLYQPLAGDDFDDLRLVRSLAFDRDNPASIVSCLTVARENAQQVRELISTEMWMKLNRLYLDVRQMTFEQAWNAQPHEFFVMVEDGSQLFQGVTDATMNHNEGWHFIQLGRFIERLIATAHALDVHYQAFPLPRDYKLGLQDYFEWLGLLKSFCAFEAYTKVYGADLRWDQILEFILFNPDFPRSARFCIDSIFNALTSISDITVVHKNSRVNKLAGGLRSSLRYDDAADVLNDLHNYLTSIDRRCSQIHDAVYETYIYRAIEASLD